MIQTPEREPGGWVSVGAGNIGQSYIDMLAKESVATRHGLKAQPNYVLRSDGWHRGGSHGEIVSGIEPTEIPPDTEVIFISTPATQDNEPMVSLMRRQLQLGKTVVTAEKTSLADNFRELTTLPGQLGYWATFGGGARLIPSLELFTLDPENVREIHLAPNATHTFIFGQVQKGKTVVEAVEMAEVAGLVEPGEPGMRDELEIIRNEAKLDIPRKMTILWNTIFPHLAALPTDALQTELDNDQVLEAIARVRSYRYLVSLYPESEERLANKAEKGRMGGFKLYHDGWLIIGGLQRVDRKTGLRFFRNSRGPQAGYFIRLGGAGEAKDDGSYGILGAGAGARPTANAMLDNFKYIRRRTAQSD